MNHFDEQEKAPGGGNRTGASEKTRLENKVPREVDASTRPRTRTLESRVLAALKQGRALTALEALQEFGAMRMAAVVYDLREKGWLIETTFRVVPCRDGRRSRIAVYHLSGKAAA